MKKATLLIVLPLLILLSAPAAEAGFWSDLNDSFGEFLKSLGLNVKPPTPEPRPTQVDKEVQQSQEVPQPVAPRSQPASVTKCPVGYTSTPLGCAAKIYKAQRPLVLVHGFYALPGGDTRSQIDNFAAFQQQLESDGLYAIGPDISYDDIKKNRVNCKNFRWLNAMSFKITYYDGGHSGIGTQSFHLYDIIRKILDCTGAPQVDIVAHSMGGLVARDYTYQLYGGKNKETVHKVIMLGTPNHGAAMAHVCNNEIDPGERYLSPEECRDMTPGSSFFDDLEKFEKEKSKYYTVALEADGIVDVESVRIADASENIKISRSKTDCSGMNYCWAEHFGLIDPTWNPEAYAWVKHWLGFGERPIIGIQNTAAYGKSPPSSTEVKDSSIPSASPKIPFIPPPQVSPAPAPAPSQLSSSNSAKGRCATLSSAVNEHTITFNVRNDNCDATSLSIRSAMCEYPQVSSPITISGDVGVGKEIPVGETSTFTVTVSNDGSYIFGLYDTQHDKFQGTQVVTVGSPVRLQYEDIIVPDTPIAWDDDDTKIPIEVKIKNVGTTNARPSILLYAISPTGKKVFLFIVNYDTPVKLPCADYVISPQSTYSHKVTVRPKDPMEPGRWEVISSLYMGQGNSNPHARIATWDQGTSGGRFITII